MSSVSSPRPSTRIVRPVRCALDAVRIAGSVPSLGGALGGCWLIEDERENSSASANKSLPRLEVRDPVRFRSWLPSRGISTVFVKSLQGSMI
eukprot:m.241207 g.241207  ORF g.241207 m.241207 type:complete len:92 (+) comp54418_c0_seq2:102-377(+)